MEYNWAVYYRNAYEKEKKKNTALAGEVADAEAKREELEAKYTALRHNPLYRMSRALPLAKRGLKKVLRGMAETGKRDREDPEMSAALALSYKERLEAQRDVYGQWIKEEEPALKRRRLEEIGTAGDAEKPRGMCRIVSYRELAGLKELSELPKSGAWKEKEPELFLFAEEPADLDEGAAAYIEHWFRARRNTRLLYGAEDHRKAGKRSFPWFKPCFSPDTLLGFFYIGSYFAVDAAWAMRTPLPGDADAKKNLYGFALRLLKPYYEKDSLAVCGRESAEIACTDLVLYHRKSSADFRMPADMEYFLHTGEMRAEANTEFWGYEKEYIKLKQDFINSIGYDAKPYQTFHPDVWAVVPAAEKEAESGAPLLSVVIPSKDHPELLKKCIGSFVERTNFPKLRENVEFIVADNGSTEKNRLLIENFLSSSGIVYRYLYKPMAFNFSAMCNGGAAWAKGKYILLLNDDMEIVEENWLRILLGQAQMPGIGAVGAKLWYPDGEKIQHAGVTNMSVGPSHKMTTFPDDRVYYYGHNTVCYDMIAVTGACLLVKKSVYEKAGGLDENMAVSYNDVDFCFTLTEMGLRNVLRNDAVLLHHESASRGLDGESAEKWQRLLEEKTKLYKKHPLFLEYDPYYSEQLAGYASDYHVCYRYPYEQPLLTAKAGRSTKKAELPGKRSDLVKLTIDRIRERNKIYLEEPDILQIEGWSYMQGKDNCLFERFLVLEAERGDFCYLAPVKEWLRPDVEAILQEQKNIELSGFTCGIVKQDLISGSYRVGMLYRNLCDGRKSYQRADRVIKV